MRARAIPAVLVAVVAAGCTASATDSPGAPEGEDAGAAVTAAPGERLTLLPQTEPAAAALAASDVFFDSSPVVVSARADDRPGLLLAASAAVGLGVPLLVDDGDGFADELDRLDAGTVLAVGEADGAGADGPDVVRVPARAGAVAASTGLPLDEVEEVAAEDELEAVADLDRDEPVALVDEAPDDPRADDDVEQLPRVRPGADRAGTVVLVPAEDDAVAAVATARAAGAQVVVLDGPADPRGSEAARTALADEGTESVVALGDLAADEGLDWKVETAASGTELPGGGQLLFPGRLLVALYGYPGSAALGVLGEQPVEAAIQRARDHAAPYEPLAGGRTVVPSFEIIATVASEFPGPDGNYSTESEVDALRPWVEAAGEAGVYVVLDLQPGRTDFVTQAERYRPLLELPHVGLALDPEWRLAPDQVHLTQIGSVGVEEVNRVVGWLADLTREARLPQKLLVLHQFRTDMLPGREALDVSRDELAVLVHADGQGSQGDKQATWNRVREGAPPVWWGWKNFYDEDAPMLTPEQTMEQVQPAPDLVSYQ